MGIPYYFSYLIQNHQEIIENIEFKKSCDSLYLDSNSIIYESIDFDKYENHEQFEKLIINNVINKIETIINIINPLLLVYIAFDGVPPIAKLSQQKNRRYKSWFQANLFNKNVLWDTCAITPGTKFMNKLNTIITNHFNKMIAKYKIILSLTNQPGEGEHKICQYIRNNNPLTESIIIYGMDADLIMLSLNHMKYCNSIYLYRETPHFIKSLNNSLDPNKNYLININILAQQIYKSIIFTNLCDNTPEWLINAEEELIDTSYNYINYNLFYNKIEDYIFICFLLGNDFMPHFPAINIRINGFTILLELYKKLFNKNQFLTKDGKIIWSNFKKYIGELAKNEHVFLTEIYNIRNKQSKKYYPENNNQEKEAKFIAMPSWNRNIELFINPYEECWEFRYYYSLFDINDNNDNHDNHESSMLIKNVCINYLETLQWTYYYYSQECINWSHSYNYKYPPLLSDLYRHIPYFDSELVLSKNKEIIHEYVLLSYVLSKNSLNLLPSKIHNYLLKNYENHYKTDYEFSYAFCKYFWEGHVNFPAIDFDNFTKNINKLT